MPGSALGFGTFAEGKTKLLPRKAYILIKTVAIQWNYVLIEVVVGM